MNDTTEGLPAGDVRRRGKVIPPRRSDLMLDQVTASCTAHDGQAVTITVDQTMSVYTAFRQYLIHEDDLVNQRTTWSITLQSFIIATFGLAFKNGLTIGESGMDSGHIILVLSLSFLGLGVSCICLFSVRAAQIAIRGLCTRWDTWRRRHPIVTDYPPLTGGGERAATSWGHALPIVLQGFSPLSGSSSCAFSSCSYTCPQQHSAKMADSQFMITSTYAANLVK